jgi:hypothetical protein
VTRRTRSASVWHCVAQVRVTCVVCVPRDPAVARAPRNVLISRTPYRFMMVNTPRHTRHKLRDPLCTDPRIRSWIRCTLHTHTMTHTSDTHIDIGVRDGARSPVRARRGRSVRWARCMCARHGARWAGRRVKPSAKSAERRLRSAGVRTYVSGVASLSPCLISLSRVIQLAAYRAPAPASVSSTTPYSESRTRGVYRTVFVNRAQRKTSERQTRAHKLASLLLLF